MSLSHDRQGGGDLGPSSLGHGTGIQDPQHQQQDDQNQEGGEQVLCLMHFGQEVVVLQRRLCEFQLSVFMRRAEYRVVHSKGA